MSSPVVCRILFRWILPLVLLGGEFNVLSLAVFCSTRSSILEFVVHFMYTCTYQVEQIAHCVLPRIGPIVAFFLSFHLFRL